MSKLGEYHSDLEAIRRVMEEPEEGFCTCGRSRSDQCWQCCQIRDGKEPVLSAEDQMERRCDALIRDLDELLAFTADPETVDLVDKQYLAVSQMVARIQLVAGFLNARKPRLTVVSNVR